MDWNHDSRPLSDELEQTVSAFRDTLPLRLELDAVARVLGTLPLEGATCLDIAFRNPVASRALRRLGGYWTTVVWKPQERRLAGELLAEEVLAVGADGELPFEDKQFDVAVVGGGRLGRGRAADERLVHECHRVLKPSGHIILNGDYAKRFGFANLLARSRGAAGGGGYTESQLFALLKTGFDVLGIKTYCRFWVQLVQHILDRPDERRAVAGGVYRVAHQLDMLGFLTKGYQIIAYGRRKGWRPRQTPVLTDGRSISSAVLRPQGR